MFYYCVYSPVILIEFDQEHPRPLGQTPDHASDVPTQTHIHSIVRTPSGNNYGQDWLRRHLAEDHADGEKGPSEGRAGSLLDRDGSRE